MKLIRVAIRSFNNHRLSCRIQRSQMIGSLSTSPFSSNEIDDKQSNNSYESVDDFSQRIFGESSGSNPNSDSFFQKLDRLERARDRRGWGSKYKGGNSSLSLNDLDESFNKLSDGMDEKLKKEATYFEVNPEEFVQEDYCFRPDVSYNTGVKYTPRDLDLTKPRIQRDFIRKEFYTTTEEVLRKADFRNVRFLSKFLTEGGIIIKRRKTGISAKAQRKVAREIKTARAFGLLPFTTMGTKSFAFGKTMEDLEQDFEYFKTVDPEETQDPYEP